MNKKIFLSFVVLLTLLFAACSESGRLDQKGGLRTPSEATITAVVPTNGGAVIHVAMPDDPYVTGVVATYTRNGEKVNTRISKYLDTLVIEGLADTEEHEVELRSFNADDEVSEAQVVKFTPLEAPINLVDFTVTETFGGIKVKVTNNTFKNSMAVVVRADTVNANQDLDVSERKWKDVTTMFTSSDNVTLVRRGMEPVKTVFAIYLRDHWNNVSKTKLYTLTPIYEQQLDKNKFTQWSVTGNDDSPAVSSYYPVKGLWDGSGASQAYKFYCSSNVDLPGWITVNLGVESQLSRIGILPRQAYDIWAGGNIRILDFWGALDDPKTSSETTEWQTGSTWKGKWVHLGQFEWVKPSGYLPDGSVGDITQEDAQYYNYDAEYEFDKDLYPNANDKIRYLRVVCLHTFSSHDSGNLKGMAWQLGEITPYGSVIE